MEHADFLHLWNQYDKKLEQHLQLNKKNATDIISLKVGAHIRSMKPLKFFTLAIGILWVGVGFWLLMNVISNAYSAISKFFFYSVASQLLLTAIAIAIYLFQLILIQQADINRPVVETQVHLARLRSSTLWVTRILFLQLPFWTTFYLSESILKNAGVFFLLVQSIITLFFTVAATWLFINIKYANRNKKWFRLIFEGNEWTPVIQSLELLKEADELNNPTS